MKQLKPLIQLYKREKWLFKAIGGILLREGLMIIVPLTVFGFGLWWVITDFLHHPHKPMIDPAIEKGAITLGLIKAGHLTVKRKFLKAKARLASL